MNIFLLLKSALINSNLLFALIIVGYALITAISDLLGIQNSILTFGLRLYILISSVLIIANNFNKKSDGLLGLIFLYALFFLLFLSRIIFDYLFFPENLRLSVFEYSYLIIGVCLIPSVAILLSADEVILEKSGIYILVLGTFAALLIIYSILRNQDVIGIADLFYKRRELVKINTITISEIGVSLVITSMSMFLFLRRIPKLLKLVLVSIVIAGLFTLLMGASRGPMVILVMILALCFFSVIRFSNKSIFLLFLMFIIIAYKNFDIFKFFETSNLIRRLHFGLFHDESRKYFFNSGLNLITKNFYLGSGVEPLKFYPHNLVLESFLLNGIVSGILFCLIVAGSIYCLAYQFIEKTEYRWISLLYLQFLGGAMLTGSLYSSYQFWVLISLIYGVSSKSRNLD